VLRDVRFNLSLENPHHAGGQGVQVSGDRTQLDALNDAVSHYVQHLLDADLSTSNTALLQLTPQSPRLLSPSPDVVATNGTSTAVHPPLAAADNGIFLEPRGLLAHDLHLGSLSTPASGDVIRLSAVQLFDLANALDDYATEILALPEQRQTAAKTRQWAGIAAMLVLAIGATGGIAKFVTDLSAPMSGQVAQDSLSDEGTTFESLPNATSSVPGEPLPVPGSVPPEGLRMPPTAPPGSTQPGAFPFPVPGAQNGAAPGVPGQAIPPGANPGAAAGRPAPPPTAVPPGAIAQSPQFPPGAAPGATVPPGPTVLRAEPEFSVSQAPGLGATAESAPGAAGDAAIAPPPTARNRPTTDLSQAGVEIPQTNELQSYFQERWQPPEALTETLEYRLVVGPNGSVRQIVPLGDAAGVYIDRTGMPLLGDTVVSPLAPYQTAMIRVVLAPDGRVQTFLEELN